MKVALVHDYLVNMGGAENVLEQIMGLFPGAPIYTAVHAKGSVSPVIENAVIRTSFIQHLPAAKTHWQYYLPLMPKAFESFDLDGYDLVISSSHACAKGVIVKPMCKHICYCHTPMRYVWSQFDQYAGGLKPPARFMFTRLASRLRRWDKENSLRVDHFIANSSAVADRIRSYYDRDSEIIFPPVDIDYFTLSADDRDRQYYLVVSRFTPYKRVDMAIQACVALGRRLKVVGAEVGKGSRVATADASADIEFLGVVKKDELRELYRGAKALIMPAEEDFGITMVEAHACGTPVIALKRGGALDIVIDGRTGIFFDDPEPQALIGALHRFEAQEFKQLDIRLHSEAYSRKAFIDHMRAAIALFISDDSYQPLFSGNR